MTFNVQQSGRPGVTQILSNMGNVTDRTYNQLQEMQQTFMSNIGNVSDTFKQRIVDTYETLGNKVNIQRAMSVLINNGIKTGMETIHLITPDNMGEINAINKQFIMANPNIRRLTDLSRLNGFDGLYQRSDTIYGDNMSLEYMRATSDKVVTDSNGNNIVRHLFRPGNETLTLNDKVVINNNWEFMNEMIANGEDPTDIG